MNAAAKFVIYGRPATKKNSGMWTGKVLLPSKAYRKYEKAAVKQLQAQNRLKKFVSDRPLSCRVHYYLRDKRWWPDLVGLMQATADILQAAGIIEDDQNIWSWDGTEIKGMDKENPRAEIWLFAYTQVDQTAYKLIPKLIQRVEEGYYEE